MVLIVCPSVLVTVDVDVEEEIVDSLILGDFDTLSLIVFPLVFTVGSIVVIVRLNVVVADSVEMFDIVALLAFITVTVDSVVGISVVVETIFVVSSFVNGLLVAIATELFALETLLDFGGVDDVVLVL